MTRRPEDLDELIDRVAAELTAVPSDPALAGRVVARLESERAATFGWPRLAAAAAAAAGAVLVAWLVTDIGRDGRDMQMPAGPATSAGAAEPAVVQPTPSAAAAESQLTAVSVPPRRAATRWITHTREVPQLDPLSSPELLAIDELSTAPLSIAPVAIAPLDLASLAMDEDEQGGPKE